MRYKVKAKPDTVTRSALEFLPLDKAEAFIKSQKVSKKTEAILIALLRRIG